MLPDGLVDELVPQRDLHPQSVGRIASRTQGTCLFPLHHGLSTLIFQHNLTNMLLCIPLLVCTEKKLLRQVVYTVTYVPSAYPFMVVVDLRFQPPLVFLEHIFPVGY
jgi:hypothetical protein